MKFLSAVFLSFFMISNVSHAQAPESLKKLFGKYSGTVYAPYDHSNDGKLCTMDFSEEQWMQTPLDPNDRTPSRTFKLISLAVYMQGDQSAVPVYPTTLDVRTNTRSPGYNSWEEVAVDVSKRLPMIVIRNSTIGATFTLFFDKGMNIKRYQLVWDFPDHRNPNYWCNINNRSK